MSENYLTGARDIGKQQNKKVGNYTKSRSRLGVGSLCNLAGP